MGLKSFVTAGALCLLLLWVWNNNLTGKLKDGFFVAQRRSMSTQCFSCACSALEEVFRLHDFSLHNIVCVHMVPYKIPLILDLKDVDSMFGLYKGVNVRFLADVASSGELRRSGPVVMLLGDDGTLPRQLTRSLCTLGVPFVSQAFRIRKSRDEIRDVLFVPDPHFLYFNGFENITRSPAFSKPFAQRAPTVYWRGSTTGNCDALVNSSDITRVVQYPAQTFPSSRTSCCHLLKRVGLVQSALSIPWIDAKLTKYVQCCLGQDQWLESRNLTSGRSPEDSWVRSRGVIEIDGNVNAWGYRWRMESGSVVFRVDGPYVNQYILPQKPWVHYIPIAHDLSDLRSKTELITVKNRDMLNKLERIARNSKELAMKYTIPQEVKRVARALNSIWSGKVDSCGSQ
jgi:hypothetical protein